MGLASREGNPDANESPGWLKELSTKVLRDDYSSSADLPKSIQPSRGFSISLSRPKTVGLERKSWKVCIPCKLRDSWLNYAVSIVKFDPKGRVWKSVFRANWKTLDKITWYRYLFFFLRLLIFFPFFFSFKKEISISRILANICETV